MPQKDQAFLSMRPPPCASPVASGLDQAFLQQPAGRAGLLQRLSMRLEVQTGGICTRSGRSAHALQPVCVCSGSSAAGWLGA